MVSESICHLKMILVIIMTLITTSCAAPTTTETNTRNAICGELGDCISPNQGCPKICGCGRLYYYNKTENGCVLDMKYLRELMKEQFDTEAKIQRDADQVFRGILISALLFITCACLCTITACIYCFRVSYTTSSLLCIFAVTILMDMVFTTVGVVTSMALVCCLCCLYMKLSDLKMKSCVIETAKRKGLQIDLDQLDPKYSQSRLANENCTILVPDVGIVL